MTSNSTAISRSSWLRYSKHMLHPTTLYLLPCSHPDPRRALMDSCKRLLPNCPPKPHSHFAPILHTQPTYFFKCKSDNTQHSPAQSPRDTSPQDTWLMPFLLQVPTPVLSDRSKLLIAWQGDGLDDLWGHTQPPDSAIQSWHLQPLYGPCSPDKPYPVVPLSLCTCFFLECHVPPSLPAKLLLIFQGHSSSVTSSVRHSLPDFPNRINSSLVDVSIAFVQHIFTSSQLCWARHQGNINQIILSSRSSRSSGETNE